MYRNSVWSSERLVAVRDSTRYKQRLPRRPHQVAPRTRGGKSASPPACPPRRRTLHRTRIGPASRRRRAFPGSAAHERRQRVGVGQIALNDVEVDAGGCEFALAEGASKRSTVVDAWFEIDQVRPRRWSWGEDHESVPVLTAGWGVLLGRWQTEVSLWRIAMKRRMSVSLLRVHRHPPGNGGTTRRSTSSARIEVELRPPAKIGVRLGGVELEERAFRRGATCESRSHSNSARHSV